jgi:hypothetical protein
MNLQLRKTCVRTLIASRKHTGITLWDSKPRYKSSETYRWKSDTAWRVFSALKWAFADFEDEYVALDLPHIPEPARSETTKELELRLQQLLMLLHTFHTE